LCLRTASWEGLVAAALGGADLAVPVGPAVAAIAYTLLVRASARASR
jgi:hypothetical protein